MEDSLENMALALLPIDIRHMSHVMEARTVGAKTPNDNGDSYREREIERDGEIKFEHSGKLVAMTCNLPSSNWWLFINFHEISCKLH